jgi:hypothetical protein
MATKTKPKATHAKKTIRKQSYTIEVGVVVIPKKKRRSK